MHSLNKYSLEIFTLIYLLLVLVLDVSFSSSPSSLVSSTSFVIVSVVFQLDDVHVVVFVFEAGCLCCYLLLLYVYCPVISLISVGVIVVEHVSCDIVTSYCCYCCLLILFDILCGCGVFLDDLQSTIAFCAGVLHHVSVWFMYVDVPYSHAVCRGFQFCSRGLALFNSVLFLLFFWFCHALCLLCVW